MTEKEQGITFIYRKGTKKRDSSMNEYEKLRRISEKTVREQLGIIQQAYARTLEEREMLLSLERGYAGYLLLNFSDPIADERE